MSGRAVLGSLPLFHGVGPARLDELAAAGSIRRLEAGAWLFREGDAADCLFVALSGRLRIVVARDGEERTVRELTRGVAVGELALLTGSPRSASAQAVRDSTLLEIPAQAFHRLLETDPLFARALSVELARQLQASGGLQEQESAPRVFSVTAGREGIDAVRFAGALADEMGKGGTVVTIGPGTGEPGSWAAALARAEAEHRHVVLVGGGDGAWDAFVRRHGDRTLLLVDGDTLVDAAAGVSDLILLAPVPTGRVAAWLDAVRPGAHHLVYGAAFEIGVARVARRLTGRSVGLVLSGGGARGLAHVGALAALEEAGIAVDRLGGCSMGAYVAGLAALGLDASQIEGLCREELVRREPFNDWTIPRVALLRSRKAERMLRRLFGDLQVEELPRPLYTVSADLVSSDIVVHRRGPLADAVGISMSIPGLVPPVARSGRLLVDGGVLNNLPVDLMDEVHEGPIVAVDVVRRLDGTSSETPRIPAITETITRATMLGSVERAERNRGLATLLVSPATQDIGLREFKALDRAIAAGYAATAAALQDGGADLLRDAMR